MLSLWGASSHVFLTVNLMQLLLLSHFQENWSSEMLSNLPKINSQPLEVESG